MDNMDMMVEEEFAKVKKNKNFDGHVMLRKYLNNIYNDLSSRTGDKGQRFLRKINFLDFLGLPSIISENIYRTFDRQNSEKLSIEDFSEGMVQLMTGSLEDVLKIIFNMCDFDNDGFIYIEDFRLILKHVEDSKNQLTEFDHFLLINKFNKKTFDEEDFKYFLKNTKIISYLIKIIFVGIPINIDSANIFKLEKNNATERDSIGNNTNAGEPENEMITHYTNERIFLIEDDEEEIEETVFVLNTNRESVAEGVEEEMNVASDHDEGALTIRIPMLKSMHRLTSLNNTSHRSTTDTIKEEKENSNFNKNLESVIDKDYFKNDSLKKIRIMESKNQICEFHIPILRSPEINIKSNLKTTSFDSHNLRLQKNKTLKNLKMRVSDKFKFENLFEGFVYKLTSNNSLRKFWITFINNDIFYFNSSKNKFKGLHNFSKCYAEIGSKEEFHNKFYYSFDYIFKNRRRTYYCETHEESLMWVNSLWKVTGFRDINEYYEIFEKLSKGQFGEVKLGIDKQTKNKVAVKIINKSILKPHEAEAIRLEAEILSKCKHKNIVTLIDNFETADTIYLILEHLAGGDLTSFLIKQDELISDTTVKKIILQLAEGLKYLSNLGIIHRDLKPDNLMFTKDSVLKIVDFGLSRIVGYKMKIYEESGTLAFVAPEVIQGKGYNIEIDMWSLGIILYYLFSGKLPFEDPNKDPKIIARKIAQCEVTFPDKLWSNVPPAAVALTKNCLSEQAHRINVDQFINHYWFTGIKQAGPKRVTFNFNRKGMNK